MANKLAQAWVRLDTPLRELQTFGKSFTEKGSILGKKSTFKNLSLSIHKNKSPCCIQTRDLRVYIERDTHPVFVILTDSKWVEIDIFCRTVIKRLKSLNKNAKSQIVSIPRSFNYIYDYRGQASYHTIFYCFG